MPTATYTRDVHEGRRANPSNGQAHRPIPGDSARLIQEMAEANPDVEMPVGALHLEEARIAYAVRKERFFLVQELQHRLLIDIQRSGEQRGL